MYTSYFTNPYSICHTAPYYLLDNHMMTTRRDDDSVCYHIDGLVQERRNSSALAMELSLSCTMPLIYSIDTILCIYLDLVACYDLTLHHLFLLYILWNVRFRNYKINKLLHWRQWTGYGLKISRKKTAFWGRCWPELQRHMASLGLTEYFFLVVNIITNFDSQLFQKPQMEKLLHMRHKTPLSHPHVIIVPRLDIYRISKRWIPKAGKNWICSQPERAGAFMPRELIYILNPRYIFSYMVYRQYDNEMCTNKGWLCFSLVLNFTALWKRYKTKIHPVFISEKFSTLVLALNTTQWLSAHHDWP